MYWSNYRTRLRSSLPALHGGIVQRLPTAWAIPHPKISDITTPVIFQRIRKVAAQVPPRLLQGPWGSATQNGTITTGLPYGAAKEHLGKLPRLLHAVPQRHPHHLLPLVYPSTPNDNCDTEVSMIVTRFPEFSNHMMAFYHRTTKMTVMETSNQRKKQIQQRLQSHIQRQVHHTQPQPPKFVTVTTRPPLRDRRHPTAT